MRDTLVSAAAPRGNRRYLLQTSALFATYRLGSTVRHCPYFRISLVRIDVFSALLNVIVALNFSVVTWASFMSLYGIFSKVGLFRYNTAPCA
jgi:hypothetical protein